MRRPPRNRPPPPSTPQSITYVYVIDKGLGGGGANRARCARALAFINFVVVKRPPSLPTPLLVFQRFPAGSIIVLIFILIYNRIFLHNILYYNYIMKNG